MEPRPASSLERVTMSTSISARERPEVDERLVMPECGYEIVDGEVCVVSLAHEPHGYCHARLAGLLGAHAASGYAVAVDMLTRTSATSDFAPDASVYPAARAPRTGGRQLEELAFEVVSTESVAHAGRKAASLRERGVRRVLAIDVERGRVLEWSIATAAWEVFGVGAAIEDPALAVPLRIGDLVDAASTDDAIARALLAKGNPVLTKALATVQADASTTAQADAIVRVLVARGLTITDAQRRIILDTRDATVLARWLERVAICVDVAALLDD